MTRKERNVHEQPPRRLDSAFIARVRRAWEERQVQAGFVGALYWSTQDERTYSALQGEWRRLERLAETLRYSGPIFDAETR